MRKDLWSKTIEYTKHRELQHYANYLSRFSQKVQHSVDDDISASPTAVNCRSLDDDAAGPSADTKSQPFAGIFPIFLGSTTFFALVAHFFQTNIFQKNAE